MPNVTITGGSSQTMGQVRISGAQGDNAVVGDLSDTVCATTTITCADNITVTFLDITDIIKQHPSGYSLEGGTGCL